MKYSEMIKRYKKGSLDEENRELVEKDIERHEAISDYLYENDRLPDIAEDSSEKVSPEKLSEQEAKAREETEKIIKTIKSRFRDSFIFFSVLLLALAVVVAGIMIWAVPQWEKDRYYNALGTSTKLSFKQSASRYTRLFAPDKKWDELRIDDNGSGNYSFSVDKMVADTFSFSRTGSHDYFNDSDYYKRHNITGTINKGKLEINGENVFAPRDNYPFYPYYAGVTNESRSIFPEDDTLSIEEMKKDTAAAVAQTSETGIYNVYLTFDKVYTAKDAEKMLREAVRTDDKDNYGMMSIWLAVCQKMGDYDVYEASTTMGVTIYNAIGDYGEYQYASETDLAERIRDVAGSEDFMKMMGCNEINPFYRASDVDTLFGGNPPKGHSSIVKTPFSSEYAPHEAIAYLETPWDLDARYKCEAAYLSRFADNIEKNGVFTYGCYYEGVRGNTIKALANDPHISYICIEQVA